MSEKEGESLRWLQKRFGYSEEDVRKWFDIVRYPPRVTTVEKEKLELASQILVKAGVLGKVVDLDALIVYVVDDIRM